MEHRACLRGERLRWPEVLLKRVKNGQDQVSAELLLFDNWKFLRRLAIERIGNPQQPHLAQETLLQHVWPVCPSSSLFAKSQLSGLLWGRDVSVNLLPSDFKALSVSLGIQVDGGHTSL